MVQFSLMTDESSEIVVVSTRIDPSVLAQLVGRFEDMVKYVVDTEPKVVAVGGEYMPMPRRFFSKVAIAKVTYGGLLSPGSRC